jgi:hypothetical protein
MSTTAIDPQVPGDQESGEVVKAEFGPLVEAAFERHEAVEVDDDHRERDVEQDHREQPEGDVRGAEFACDADPGESDDEEDLGEDEVAEAEFFFEFGGVGGEIRHSRHYGTEHWHKPGDAG